MLDQNMIQAHNEVKDGSVKGRIQDQGVNEFCRLS